MTSHASPAAAADDMVEPTGSAVPRLSLQERWFLFCGLMLVTGFFLPWEAASATQETSPWSALKEASHPVISFGLVGLLSLYGIALASVRRPTARPWLGISTAIAVQIALPLFAIFPGTTAYGGHLTRLFALGLLVLSADSVIAKSADLAMRRLNSRQAEVFTHWGAIVPGIHFSAQEFFAQLETAIRAHQWPGVELLRVAYTEAGLLSAQREYLRVIRQRQVFDVGASPFGQDFFFTLREAELRPQVSPATLIILLMTLGMVLTLLISASGIIAGLIQFVGLLVLGVFVLLNVLRMGLTRLDGILMRIPVIGPVYETWFRSSSSYFQHDTRMAFLKLMDELVKEHVNATASEKGVQWLDCYEHQPLLDGFYKSGKRATATQAES